MVFAIRWKVVRSKAARHQKARGSKEMQIHGAAGVMSMMGQAASASQASSSSGPSVATPATPASSSSGKTAKSAGPSTPQFGAQTFSALLSAQAGQFSL